MRRRTFLAAAGSAGAAVVSGVSARERGGFSYDRPVIHASDLTVPASGPIRVAFAISEMANVMDLAGPWEVFQDVGHSDYRLYTVGPTEEVITATGGLQIVPNYTVENAPKPHVVVVGAQRGAQSLVEWLQTVNKETDVTMSVCTGAFLLGRAGILDGHKATTHHRFFDDLEKEHPKVTVLRGPRFVDNGKIATAGGLTSGIDLALRIVARYQGDEAARATAEYMEYVGTGWREGS